MRTRSWQSRGKHRFLAAALATAIAGTAPLLANQARAQSPALERIRASETIRFGYVEGARPYSYRSASGAPAGYSVELCQHIAESVKNALALPRLKVEWVAEAYEQRLDDLAELAARCPDLESFRAALPA